MSFHLSSSNSPGLAIRGSNLTNHEKRALAFLLPLSEDYPEIETWFRNKVVPGLHLGTRVLLPIERDGELVGLGIAKNDAGERKICTVRVASNHFGRGMGLRLFDGLLKWLDDDQPHLTVSAGKLPLFARIFEYYKFDLTSTKTGLYLPLVKECCFNEQVPSNESVAIREWHPA
jgi:hypothetical protein